MNIRDGTERKVSFNARDELGDKIDKLTLMMSRLAAKDSNEKRPFKPQIYKSRGSHPQSQNRFCNQRGYQNRSRRSDSRNRGQYGNNRSRQKIRDNNFQEDTGGYGIQNNRGEYSVKVLNGWLVYSPMLIPRQLRFSLYSGAVITEGLM